jgi:hypothetical protein
VQEIIAAKRSLMHCASLRSMSNAYLQRQPRINVLLVYCFVWMFSTAAHAKMTVVTLPQLVKQSELIVYGHFSPSAKEVSNQSPAIVQFKVGSFLKGKGSIAAPTLPLCNLPDEYSDEFDLSKLTGHFILFVSRKGPCFELSHGDRSVVAVKDDRAVTIAIENQPDDQLLQGFLEKIRSLARS